ncbi:MAG: Crp/Fnr family transcriptional regulator [Rhodospirillales bacterium]|jgi:CRP/FNR family transcriptional regulator|nr:Crp/Fnr family transcriptional regulator [Rhodospirillales bacterium]
MSPTVELPRDLRQVLDAARTIDRRDACLQCRSRARTICAPVPAAAIDRLARLKLPPRRVPAGDQVYAEGAPCDEYFTVLQGWVALTTVHEDGGGVVLDYALPGDFFGFQGNSEGPRAQSAIAITPARLCPLPRQGVETLLQTDPLVSAHLAHLVAVHEARAHDHLVNSTARGARERVAHLLIELYFRQNHCLPHRPNEIIDLPLTLALIGETIGLTAVHVSRMLRRLREEGVIRFRRGKLEICDPYGLIGASGVEARPLADETTHQ